MPELPEVESLRRMLAKTIVGKTITVVEVRLPRIVRQGDPAALTGGTVGSIVRRGKYLRFDVFDRPCLYAHFGMTGGFLWVTDESKIDRWVRVVFHFGEGLLLFRDVRTLGGLWISDEIHPPWEKLGPEPLGEGISPESFRQALQGRRIPIKRSLLDQSIIAGIGNIYDSEALYRAGINPFQPAGGLSGDETACLLSAIQAVLREAIDAGGTTFRDFHLSDGREGGFACFLKVYGRENQPCESCGQPIQKVMLDSRSAYYCPQCQPRRDDATVR